VKVGTDDFGRAGELEIKAKIDRMILTFMAQNALPFSIMGSSSVRILLYELNPRDEIVSINALAYDPAVAGAHRYSLDLKVEIVEGNHFSVTIEFDAWTSNFGQRVLAVVVTCWNGKASLIDLVDISGELRTGEFLATTAIYYIQASVMELSKMKAIVSDGDSNFRPPRGIIIEEEESEHVLKYRCFGHALNLVGAFLSRSPLIKRLFKKVLDLITLISCGKPLSTAIADPAGGEVVRLVPTTQCSTFTAFNFVKKPVMLDLEDRDYYARSRLIRILRDVCLWDDLKEL